MRRPQWRQREAAPSCGVGWGDSTLAAWGERRLPAGPLPGLVAVAKRAEMLDVEADFRL